jgi:hypothetical protein
MNTQVIFQSEQKINAETIEVEAEEPLSFAKTYYIVADFHKSTNRIVNYCFHDADYVMEVIARHAEKFGNNLYRIVKITKA